MLSKSSNDETIFMALEKRWGKKAYSAKCEVRKYDEHSCTYVHTTSFSSSRVFFGEKQTIFLSLVNAAGRGSFFSCWRNARKCFNICRIGHYLFASCYLKYKVAKVMSIVKRTYFCKLLNIVEKCITLMQIGKVRGSFTHCSKHSNRSFFVISQGPADVSCQNEEAIIESYVTFYLTDTIFCTNRKWNPVENY